MVLPSDPLSRAPSVPSSWSDLGQPCRPGCGHHPVPCLSWCRSCWLCRLLLGLEPSSLGSGWGTSARYTVPLSICFQI